MKRCSLADVPPYCFLSQAASVEEAAGVAAGHFNLSAMEVLAMTWMLRRLAVEVQS